jgi:hypothetical protein
VHLEAASTRPVAALAALQAQRLSVAVHIASAWEIATEMQRSLLGVGARRPPLMRTPPRRESAPYFAGPRCVFVCVCVLLVCVLSSRCLVQYVGRPICVCAVSAPLRRVNPFPAPGDGRV